MSGDGEGTKKRKRNEGEKKHHPCFVIGDIVKTKDIPHAVVRDIKEGDGGNLMYCLVWEPQMEDIPPLQWKLSLIHIYEPTRPY